MSTELQNNPQSEEKAPRFRNLRKAQLKGAVTEVANRLLVVDDDPSYCRLASHMLKSRGYEVESSSNPLKVIEEVERVKPAVVLLDICMDGKSGLQVLRDLQAYDRGLTVIMVTGLVAEKTLIDARSMGAAACVFKPINGWLLLSSLIDGALERNRSWRMALRKIKNQ